MAATFLALFFVFVTSGSFTAALAEQEVVLRVPEIQPSTSGSYHVYRRSELEDFDTGHGPGITTARPSRKNRGHGPVITAPRPSRKKHGYGPVNTHSNRELQKYNRGHGSVNATSETSTRHGPLPTGPARSRYEPQHDDLRPEVLFEKLGTDFDVTWMSLEEPLPVSTNAHVRDTTVDAQLQKALSRLDFRLRDDQGRQLPVRSSTRRYLERWLTERSSCPVQMVWEDLGVSFWPRWVRKGVCDSSTSCSWPPGMHCVPEASRKIRILHWQCRRGNRKWRRMSGREKGMRWRDEVVRCRWKKVPFPVTAGCHCSC